MYQFLIYIKNLALDLLFPARCIGCLIKEGTFLCTGCRGRLHFVPPSCFVCKRLVPSRGRVTAGRTCRSCQDQTCIYAYFSPFLYEDTVIKEMLHLFKFQRVKILSQIFAELLRRYVGHFSLVLPSPTLCVPIPLHSRRQRVRSFNQSEEVCRQLQILAPSLQCITALKRVRNTVPQTSLSGTKRGQNIAEAFAVSDPQLISGRTIILFDDIKTTGATLEEAARVLKQAGAKHIWAMTIAH